MEYLAVIEQVVEHLRDTRSLFLRLSTGRRLVFKPGQFLSFRLPVNGQILTRPYSITSDPENGALLEICFNLVPGGLGSQYLWTRAIGDVLRFTGPWGTFFLDSPPQSECVFIAEGIGVVPLRPMIRRTLCSDDMMTSLQLLYGAVSEDALLFQPEFRTWEKKNSHFRFEPLLLNRSSERGERISLAETVEQKYVLADSDRSRHFYICGVGNVVTEIRDLLRQAGYQRQAVRYEKW